MDEKIKVPNVFRKLIQHIRLQMAEIDEDVLMLIYNDYKINAQKVLVALEEKTSVIIDDNLVDLAFNMMTGIRKTSPPRGTAFDWIFFILVFVFGMMAFYHLYQRFNMECEFVAPVLDPAGGFRGTFGRFLEYFRDNMRSKTSFEDYELKVCRDAGLRQGFLGGLMLCLLWLSLWIGGHIDWLTQTVTMGLSDSVADFLTTVSFFIVASITTPMLLRTEHLLNYYMSVLTFAYLMNGQYGVYLLSTFVVFPIIRMRAELRRHPKRQELQNARRREETDRLIQYLERAAEERQRAQRAAEERQRLMMTMLFDIARENSIAVRRAIESIDTLSRQDSNRGRKSSSMPLLLPSTTTSSTDQSMGGGGRPPRFSPPVRQPQRRPADESPNLLRMARLERRHGMRGGAAAGGGGGGRPRFPPPPPPPPPPRPPRPPQRQQQQQHDSFREFTGR